VGGLWTSATSRHALLNGVKGPEDTLSCTPSQGTSRFGINGLYRATLIGTGDQRLAEVGVWNRALSDAEWAILAGSAGVFGSPLLIPSGLVEYHISDGTHDEIGAALTDVGTPTGAAHPSVLYPTTGGAAIHYYRQMRNA
jgi:hypothetical protein